MNSSEKAKCHGAFPRVRKRNSTCSKLPSHNATQYRASLLKNNKSLAITLEETRCELSTYRNLFEESLEYMSKAKLAKSKMIQLSTAFKNLIKDFDESLLTLEFDDSKWANIKASTQSNKNAPKGLNPVFEVTNEMEEVAPTDQEMNCDEEDGQKSSDQAFESTSNPSKVFQKADLQNTIQEEKSRDNPEVTSKLPKKRIVKIIENDSKTKNVKENMKKRGKILKFSPRRRANSNYSIKTLSSSQATKVTKIPRCESLASDLQKQNILKESKPQDKTCKLKSSEKRCEESNSVIEENVIRRKTFVIKSNNILENLDFTENATEKNNTESTMEETSKLTESKMISKIDKRKTFVKKSNEILKETEETTSENEFFSNNDRRKTRIIKNIDSLKTTELSVNLKKMIEIEVPTENRVVLSELTDIEEDDVFVSKDNNRKIFVKESDNKAVLYQDNDAPECQTSFTNNGCTSLNPELVSAGTENKVLKTFSELQLNLVDLLSTTDHGTATNTNELFSAERFKPPVEDIVHNETLKAPSNTKKQNDKTVTPEQSIAKEKIEEISQNLKSKIDSNIINHNLTETVQDDILNKGIIFSDDSSKDENVINKLHKSYHNKSYNSSFEDSDPENEVLLLEEINFSRSPSLPTPIRRQISNKKKNKFVFDVKKRKSILKKNSFCENNNNSASVNENDVNGAKVKNVHFISGADNPVSLQSDSLSVRKKATKTSAKRITDNPDAPIKSNTKKKPSKTRTLKNTNKGRDEVDDLILKPKKIKKRNIKKKKNEDIHFDDSVISKCKENDEITVSKTDGIRKDFESDFPCEKTGKNTFLVHAEIHPPPPSVNKENEKLNLQVAVVLDDVLKSKDIEFLKISDRDLLSTGTVFLKSPFTGNSSYTAIDPNESIEKMRSDYTPESDDVDLHSDALLNTSNCDLRSSPVRDSRNIDLRNSPVKDTEQPRGRRRKDVNYKEPSLHRKMRRC